MTKRAVVRLDEETAKKLKLIALHEDSSVQDILEALVKNYIKEYEKENAITL